MRQKRVWFSLLCILLAFGIAGAGFCFGYCRGVKQAVSPLSNRIALPTFEDLKSIEYTLWTSDRMEIEKELPKQKWQPILERLSEMRLVQTPRTCEEKFTRNAQTLILYFTTQNQEQMQLILGKSVSGQPGVVYEALDFDFSFWADQLLQVKGGTK